MYIDIKGVYAERLIAALAAAKSGKALSTKTRHINIAMKLVEAHTVK